MINNLLYNIKQNKILYNTNFHFKLEKNNNNDNIFINLYTVLCTQDNY